MKKIVLTLVVIAVIGLAFYLIKNYRDNAIYRNPAFACGNGRLEATEISISTKLSGKIEGVLVNEGDYVKENQKNCNRLGISVSKKVGNSVVRHRLTRLIRESYRLKEEKFQCGYDIIVIARVGAKEKNYFDIESALIHLGHLHNIIYE